MERLIAPRPATLREATSALRRDAPRPRDASVGPASKTFLASSEGDDADGPPYFAAATRNNVTTAYRFISAKDFNKNQGRAAHWGIKKLL